MDTNYAPTGKGNVTGKGVGDFDFLAGEWKIQHKRLKGGTKDEWQNKTDTRHTDSAHQNKKNDISPVKN